MAFIRTRDVVLHNPHKLFQKFHTFYKCAIAQHLIVFQLWEDQKGWKLISQASSLNHHRHHVVHRIESHTDARSMTTSVSANATLNHSELSAFFYFFNFSLFRNFSLHRRRACIIKMSKSISDAANGLCALVGFDKRQSERPSKCLVGNFRCAAAVHVVVDVFLSPNNPRGEICFSLWSWMLLAQAASCDDQKKFLLSYK